MVYKHLNFDLFHLSTGTSFFPSLHHTLVNPSGALGRRLSIFLQPTQQAFSVNLNSLKADSVCFAGVVLALFRDA